MLNQIKMGIVEIKIETRPYVTCQNCRIARKNCRVGNRLEKGRPLEKCRAFKASMMSMLVLMLVTWSNVNSQTFSHRARILCNRSGLSYDRKRKHLQAEGPFL